jgi:4-diphosphocytidyl-2-C-methyl-D-erythritol kinase
MPVTLRSFAKINLGLHIGALRPDGFHDLRTVYQTIALHDIVRVQVARGSGIGIRCKDPRVPQDESNTCHRIIERAMRALNARGRVILEIEKRLPVQGGLGGASSNAVSALLGLERALKKRLPESERLRIAAEVGSDLPLFLVGGTVLGVGHGEEVYPLPDLTSVSCVVALPEIAVSTPKAFADWDARMRSAGAPAREPVELPSAGGRGASVPTADTGGPERPCNIGPSELTVSKPSDRMSEFSRMVSVWLRAQPKAKAAKGLSGVSARSRGRAETPLLDLVRTGIENDFEQVVFPQYPELREVKRVLERGGAFYASLSGSGSAVYGLFTSRARAEKAAAKLRETGVGARVTSTLTRRRYWKMIFD